MNLRDLILDTPFDAEPQWADAAGYAVCLFGQRLADRIVWRVDVDHQVYGTLAGDDRALTLRYQTHEPGSQELAVQVPCAAGEACRNAWDTVEDTADLIRILDGDTGEYAVSCDIHTATCGRCHVVPVAAGQAWCAQCDDESGGFGFDAFVAGVHVSQLDPAEVRWTGCTCPLGAVHRADCPTMTA